MSVQQPSISGSGTPPWQQKQLSYGLKLLITFGAALLFIILIVTLFTTIGSLSSVAGGRAARGNPNSSLVPLLVSVVLFGVSLFGLIKLFPYLSAPTNFKPSYGAVAADVRGHPFEIRYQRGGWGRSMSGKGTARFDDGGLSIEGYLTPSPLFQIGIVVVVTVIPLIVLGIGLGLIPALLIAYYAGRKRMTQAIPYMDLRSLNLKGCKVAFEHPGALPGKVAFYTSVSDGERLYRELQERFPALVVGTLQ